jgi:hypothetical protein
MASKFAARSVLCALLLWGVGCSTGVPGEEASSDGVTNDGASSGVGASSGTSSGAGNACRSGADCPSGICAAGACTAPSPTDGKKNGTETDVDCGGTAPRKCDVGGGCAAGADCTSGVCAALKCAAPSSTDKVKNGAETDVDCGGAGNPACDDGLRCAAGSDCASLICGPDNKCAAPRTDDGVKNGTETDVDCGGVPENPRCAAGKSCVDHDDCASDGCGFDKKCAVARSCGAVKPGDVAGFWGRVTCGPKNYGFDAAKKEPINDIGPQDSCCASVPLTANTTTPRMDKYMITAGRMRTFLERVNYNVRSFTSKLPAAQWPASWNALVPSNQAEAYEALGPGGGSHPRNGCFTMRSYQWDQDGAFYSYKRGMYDIRPLNCVEVYLAHAFCRWDGGRLPTAAEIVKADTAAPNTPTARGRSFQWPLDGWPVNGNNDDHMHYLMPPGRLANASPVGLFDMVGLLFHHTLEPNFTAAKRWSGSWDGHAISRTWWEVPTAQAYWALGARCIRD